MKRISVVISSMLLLLGLVIIVYDACFGLRYGVDVNDVAGISDDGYAVDWPTGLRPAFTFIPLFFYGFVFWLAAAAVISLWPELGRVRRERVCRGTE